MNSYKELRDKLNVLLAFCQHLDYEPDRQPYFAPQILNVHAKSDCEDRSVLFAILVRGEIEALTLVGIAIGTLGGVILILSDTGLVQNAPNPVLGNILVGASAGAYAIYLTLVKPLLAKRYPSN